MNTIRNDNNNDKPVGVIAMEQLGNGRKRITKKISNYINLIVGTFLILVVVFVFIAELEPKNTLEWTTLGLTFCVLLFCSYSMYVTFADSGTKSGKVCDAYITAEKTHTELKNKIINNEMQPRLNEFCNYYAQEELKGVRNRILVSVGISYKDYIEKYTGIDEAALKQCGNLSEKQIKAIVKANKVKAIHLTPEKILKQGRGDSRRNPLGASPEEKKAAHYSLKAITAFLTSALTGMIGFDIIMEPSWTTVAACLLKLLPIVLNGFMGYKMGYENIAVDTVNYMNDQSDLMHQFIQYVQKHPEPVKEEVKAEPTAPVGDIFHAA